MRWGNNIRNERSKCSDGSIVFSCAPRTLDNGYNMDFEDDFNIITQSHAKKWIKNKDNYATFINN